MADRIDSVHIRGMEKEMEMGRGMGRGWERKQQGDEEKERGPGFGWDDRLRPSGTLYICQPELSALVSGNRIM